MEMVDARRNAETKEEHFDLFSGLLDAARGDLDDTAAITEQELIGKMVITTTISFIKLSRAIPGNMFIFLLAGHEVDSPRSPGGAN